MDGSKRQGALSPVLMTHKLQWQKKRTGIFLYTLFSGIFFLLQSSASFSAEDIKGLIFQGEAVVARGDYEQAVSIGERIQKEDPRDVNGYKFALIYCASTGREAAFYKTIDEAISKGAPRLPIRELAAKILYSSGQFSSVWSGLVGYEEEWYRENTTRPAERDRKSMPRQ